MTDPLAELTDRGVAIWLDDLSRQRLDSGQLEDLVRDRHVVGVTTNPTIFQKAISGSDAYDEQLRDLTLRGVDVGEAVRAITTADVRRACDVLRPVFDATDGVDGRVSIEVDPRLAHDTDRTVAEARALWWLVDRPNLFIKVPATVAGLPAITRCLAEGISVNVTLIFSLERYGRVIDAFFAGVEQALDAGVDVPRLGSVASFFVSRVDSEVDARLDRIGGEDAAALRGRVALANARLAYDLYEEKAATDRWRRLAEAGAHPQRPLWASTSTKDPSYEANRYVAGLALPGTVNTMPEETLDATVSEGLEAQVWPADTSADEARRVLTVLEELGVSYDDVVEQLEREGVDKFEASWEELLASIERNLGDRSAAA